MDDITISSDTIPLGTFLKLAGALESGGDAKQWIAAGEVTVDGEVETRRGRKLARGNVVEVGGHRYRPI
jgi:ribosome-associated protein